ncbi:MAG TPA: TetR/AcrR family transcriptional regulator [Candidatus Acidoferrales bacterium]|nr:TetR/AcrR family transcriptional regulator [Candidatus Acidoferrales bacterium]
MEARRPYDIDSLTDVAFRIFAERGFDAASMEDVARAAGITKASIYHHVPSKEALLARGLDRALSALFGVLDEPAARNGAARERLVQIVRRVAEITISMRAEVSVLFRVRGNSKTERDAMERRRAFDALVTELVREAQAAGDVRADIEAALIVRLVFGTSNSVVEWYRPGGRTSAAAIAAAVEAIVFRGIDAPPPRG